MNHTILMVGEDGALMDTGFFHAKRIRDFFFKLWHTCLKIALNILKNVQPLV
jgi:hypothetical protein